MLDDLRNEASSSFEETSESSILEGELSEVVTHRPRRRHFLGMTPAQRFILTLLLFMMVCLLGSLCLIAFEKVVLPL